MGYTLPNGAHINTNSLAAIEAMHGQDHGERTDRL